MRRHRPSAAASAGQRHTTFLRPKLEIGERATPWSATGSMSRSIVAGAITTALRQPARRFSPLPGLAQRKGPNLIELPFLFPVTMRAAPVIQTSSMSWVGASPVGNQVSVLRPGRRHLALQFGKRPHHLRGPDLRFGDRAAIQASISFGGTWPVPSVRSISAIRPSSASRRSFEMGAASDQPEFDRCVDVVLAHEGGYVHHPADPGAATNFGITQSTLARARGRKTTETDVRLLSKEEACGIYRRFYWDTIRASEMSAGVALAVFDFAVNSGVPRARPAAPIRPRDRRSDERLVGARLPCGRSRVRTRRVSFGNYSKAA